ncbi:MAG: toxin-antitoxin system YwqK family antitoxin [Paracoccaceae bacterium]
MAEPGFFLQTLTNTFVDWVFGRLDTYIEVKPDESDEPLDKKSIQEPNKNTSEKKVSIKIDEVVERDDTFYKKFSNIPFSGHMESYHPNGQLKIIGEFSEGKKIGEWVEYYMSGVKKSEGKFANGKKDGAWVYYFLNTNIKEKQFFINGNKDGLWEKFDVHGTLIQTESYQNGKWIITTIN